MEIRHTYGVKGVTLETKDFHTAIGRSLSECCNELLKIHEAFKNKEHTRKMHEKKQTIPQPDICKFTEGMTGQNTWKSDMHIA